MTNRIIFDIETVGIDFEKFDKGSQEYLLKYSETPENHQGVKERMNFWPLTAEIVAIAVLNPDTDKGAVYFQTGGKNLDKFEENKIRFSSGTEKEILENFWKAVASYGQFISFNGRGFDAPFLILRSAINKVKPSKNLMPPRYSANIHIDLMDQLTFYGATRKFSLDFYTKSFGIKSPKADGITGAEVGKLYKNGEYSRIARYCVGDVIATKNLYEVWRDYIAIQ